MDDFVATIALYLLLLAIVLTAAGLLGGCMALLEKKPELLLRYGAMLVAAMLIGLAVPLLAPTQTAELVSDPVLRQTTFTCQDESCRKT